MSRFSAFIVVFFLSVASSAVARAQDGGMKIKFHKDRPVQLLSYSPLYDANNTSVSKRKLRKSDRFTDAEVEEIFRRLGNNALVPTGIAKANIYDKASLAHYKAYEQSSFSLLGYHFSLVWIPKDENMHMPQELQPPTSEGSVWYTYTENLSKNGKNASGAALAKAGTPVTGSGTGGGNSGGIQHSTADMSSVSRRHGTMIIYYGTTRGSGTSIHPADISMAYFYEVVGTGYVSDEAGLAGRLAARNSEHGSFIGYEWKGGYACNEAIRYYIGKTGASGGTGQCDGTVTPTGQ